MRYSTKLSDATHILLYIHVYAQGDLSSAMIASSVQTNPALVRRLMMELTNAGLLHTTKGKAAPVLTRPLAEISLYDVYHAVEVAPLLHVDTDTNLDCVVGSNIQGALGNAFARVQAVADAEMKAISLQSVLDDFKF